MSTSIWQGKRIRLRAIEPADWEAFDAFDQDSELSRHDDYVYVPRSKEASKRWAEDLATEEHKNDRYFMVIETLTGEIAGAISSHACEARNGTFSYGVALGEAYRRQGYASEAIFLLLRYFFQELRYQKVTAHVYSFNEPSLKLHEKLGFQLEGRLRRMIYTNGQFFDELLFGMTADEFAARYTL
jgi:RimJ/RimL family protein N-acetyltransferase